MSDIKVTIVGAAIAVSVAGQPIAITTVGQQGPSGPAVPALSNTNVLFSDSNQVGASPNFTFDKTTNVVTVTGNLQATNYLHHSTGSAALAAAGLQAGSGHAIGFSSIGNATGTMDTMLRRGGAGILEQYDGINPQMSRIYGTRLDGSNYERLRVGYDPASGGAYHLLTDFAGTGVARSLMVGSLGNANVSFMTQGTQRFTVRGADGHFVPGLSNTYDAGSALLPIRTGYFGTSVASPLVVSSANHLRLQSPSGYVVLVGPDGSADQFGFHASAFYPHSTTNAKDVGTTGNTFRTGYFGTSVQFGTTGIAAPTVNTRSAGAKVVLYPSLSASETDHAIGIESGHTWFSVSSASAGLGWKWYGGTTQAAKLDGAGTLTLTAGLVTPLLQSASNILEQRNGANAQTFRVANTYTDASNNETLSLLWSGNVAHLLVQQAGTGLARELRVGSTGAGLVSIYTNNTKRWEVQATTGHLVPASNYDVGSTASPVGTLNVQAVKFPATQVPSADANTLDDYKENTFTPSLTLGGAASSGMTYSIQQGRYTKVGNKVSFKATVAISAIGSGTGAVRIEGLPFVAEATANAFNAVTVYAQSLTGTTGGFMGYISPSESRALLRYTGTGAGSDMQHTNLTAASLFTISGTYFV